jgi:hypothetical protein
MQIAAVNRSTGRNSEVTAEARPIPSLRQIGGEIAPDLARRQMTISAGGGCDFDPDQSGHPAAETISASWR